MTACMSIKTVLEPYGDRLQISRYSKMCASVDDAMTEQSAAGDTTDILDDGFLN